MAYQDCDIQFVGTTMQRNHHGGRPIARICRNPFEVKCMDLWGRGVLSRIRKAASWRSILDRDISCQPFTSMKIMFRMPWIDPYWCSQTIYTNISGSTYKTKCFSNV